MSTEVRAPTARRRGGPQDGPPPHCYSVSDPLTCSAPPQPVRHPSLTCPSPRGAYSAAQAHPQRTPSCQARVSAPITFIHQGGGPSTTRRRTAGLAKLPRIPSSSQRTPRCQARVSAPTGSGWRSVHHATPRRKSPRTSAPSFLLPPVNSACAELGVMHDLMMSSPRLPLPTPPTHCCEGWGRGPLARDGRSRQQARGNAPGRFALSPGVTPTATACAVQELRRLLGTARRG